MSPDRLRVATGSYPFASGGFWLVMMAVPQGRDRTRRWPHRTDGPDPAQTPQVPGQRTGPERVARSTTTSAPGASQPAPASSESTRVTSSSGAAYGGSANTTSYRPAPEPGARASLVAPAGSGASAETGAGPRASARSTRSVITVAPGRPIASMFSLMTRAARASDSTSRTCSAPRDRASRPTAPEPAYRSSTRAPASVPTIDVTVANRPSLARSLVGLVWRPLGTVSRRPPASPAITRATSLVCTQAARRRHLAPRGTQMMSPAHLRDLALNTSANLFYRTPEVSPLPKDPGAFGLSGGFGVAYSP